MIRGKYLRERKAIRFKRRIKLILIITIIFILHRIMFNSYSVYESEANSSAAIDVAFFVLDDEYQSKVITLDDMEPGDTQYCYFSVANYILDDNDEKIVSETDMQYKLKIRTTTNLPLEYELYRNQSLDVTNLQNILEIETQLYENNYSDDDSTIFKRLVQSSLTDEQKAEGITDAGTFLFANNGSQNTYILKVTLPDQYNSEEYQNIIECIEISVEGSQIIDDSEIIN